MFYKMPFNKAAGEINNTGLRGQAGGYTGVVDLKDAQVSICTIIGFPFNAIRNVGERDAVVFAQYFSLVQCLCRHVKNIAQ